MKKSLLALCVLLISHFTYSQCYSTGFDSEESHDQWTEYRMLPGIDPHWVFTEGQSVSSPFSLFHDYPGVSNVEDWIVSPPLFFSDSCSSISISSYKISLSYFPNVYFGVWLSYGSPDPADGKYFEIMDLTDFPTVNNTWGDTTVSITPKNCQAYIAFKYSALQSCWLKQWVDNLIVSNVSPLAITDPVEQINDLIKPNPASNFISFNNTRYSNAEIYNYTGQLMLQKDISSTFGNTDIDIMNLSQGVYILRLNDGIRQKSYRFVKE